MATIDPVIVKLQADISDLKSGLERAEASLKGLDDSVKQSDSAFAGFTTRLKQLGATIGVTFAASKVVSFFKTSVAASMEAEASQARLRNLLLNTNGATESQIVALSNQAKALEQVGVVSAGNIQIAQSQLATFDLSAAAIGKLTPAILDFTTAEKGAAASGDDFKQMTNALAGALAGNYGALSKMGFPLTETQKKMLTVGTEMERATALTEILNTTYRDFNKNLRDTSEGAMQVAINDFNNLKTEIGDGLKPVVDAFAKFLTNILFPALNKLVKFLKNNADEIKVFAIAVGIGATAWGIYTIAVNKAKIAQAALNFVMGLNPIGLIIIAVGLLAAGLVKLWKNSETFRTVVVNVSKVALNAFANVVPIIAQVYEAIAKIVTGPMRLFLLALSKLPGVGKYAKTGLDAINQGLDGISDLGVKAAEKARELSKKLDGLAASAKKAGKETKDALGKDGFGKGREDGGGEVDKKTQTKIDSLKNKLKDYYKSWEKAQQDAQDKFGDAQERFNERVADAQQTYQDREKDITERFNDKMVQAQERYDETITEAKERAFNRDVELRQNHSKKIIDITKRYAKQEADIKEQLQNKINELQRNADEKRLDLRKSAADKEASLVQQSINRLRSAFASALGFNLKDEFEKGGGVTGILDAIRTKLREAAELQKNAAMLAGKGYSQTFIEQIVQAGPQIGNDMAKALLSATPENTAEMQMLFAQLETVQNNGLDVLAKSMNEGGNLATNELREQYKNVAIDLKASLQEVDAQLKLSLDNAQEAYSKAMEETAKLRKEAIDEAIKDLGEALAENERALKDALAKAEKALKETQDKAKRDLDKALADAQQTLQRSLIDSQKSFEKAVDDINESMARKLEELKIKIAEAQTALMKLGSMSMAPTPSYTPYGNNPMGFNQNPYGHNSTDGYANYNYNNNITLNQSQFTNPTMTAMSMMAYIKYGMVVTVGTPIYTEHGTVIAE